MNALPVLIFGIIIAIIGCIFGAITASYIATAVGATGLDWWIVGLTVFGAIGGMGGSLIRFNDNRW